MRKNLMAIMVLVMVMTMGTGCSEKKTETEVKNPVVDKLNVSQEKDKYISKNPTSYMMYGYINNVTIYDIIEHFESTDYVYVAVNHPAVESIIKFIDGYVDAYINIDYKTFNGRETDPFIHETVLSTDSQEEYKKLVNDKKYISKLNYIENIKIKFASGFAYVEYTVNYSKSSGGSDFKEVTRGEKLVLMTENNVWKIISIE